jgi:hypothetical protein
MVPSRYPTCPLEKNKMARENTKRWRLSLNLKSPDTSPTIEELSVSCLQESSNVNPVREAKRRPKKLEAYFSKIKEVVPITDLVYSSEDQKGEGNSNN